MRAGGLHGLHGLPSATTEFLDLDKVLCNMNPQPVPGSHVAILCDGGVVEELVGELVLAIHVLLLLLELPLPLRLFRLDVDEADLGHGRADAVLLVERGVPAHDGVLANWEIRRA